MATPVGRIEKEFLFKVLYEEELPIIYIKDRCEYQFRLKDPAGEKLLLRLVDAELTLSIEVPNRTINVLARIVRRFKDTSAGYFGCRFINMTHEDMRLLFEHLYGRQIDASNSAFLTG